jgi:NADPH-dependent ferric siderophore reductase
MVGAPTCAMACADTGASQSVRAVPIMTTGLPASPTGRKSPPVPVRVRHVEDIGAYMRRVTLEGDQLRFLPVGQPTGHIKLLLPVNGEVEPTLPTMTAEGPVFPDDRPVPLVRTFTPRRFDPKGETMVVDFVNHPGGATSAWVRAAKSGDRAAVSGTGRGYQADPATKSFVLGGDESALPAVGVLLETLPASASVQVLIEIRDEAARVDLPERRGATIEWIVREPNAPPSQALHRALRGAHIAEDSRVWVATESGAVRAIRKTLIQDRAIAPDRVVTRGYWKVNVSNHRDGDYGHDPD